MTSIVHFKIQTALGREVSANSMDLYLHCGTMQESGLGSVDVAGLIRVAITMVIPDVYRVNVAHPWDIVVGVATLHLDLTIGHISMMESCIDEANNVPVFFFKLIVFVYRTFWIKLSYDCQVLGWFCTTPIRWKPFDRCGRNQLVYLSQTETDTLYALITPETELTSREQAVILHSFEQ